MVRFLLQSNCPNHKRQCHKIRNRGNLPMGTLVPMTTMSRGKTPKTWFGFRYTLMLAADEEIQHYLGEATHMHILYAESAHGTRSSKYYPMCACKQRIYSRCAPLLKSANQNLYYTEDHKSFNAATSSVSIFSFIFTW